VEFITSLLDIALHLDTHLAVLVQGYGAWVYLILFLIVFCETGLVVTPFLPGDSLLFMTGALTATGVLEVEVATALLVSASFLGDNTNYWIGRFTGPKVFHSRKSRLLNPEHLEQAHRFYEKHGGKAILIARFFPIIRTFAPFVAGIGRMVYRRFVAFSIVGGVAWVGSLILAGYLFGNIPVVKQNLMLLILAIVALSLLPAGIGYLRHRAARSAR
jgi:membrane-associated protein